MSRQISVSTILSRLFHNKDMLSTNDFLTVLPYRTIKILHRNLKINKVKIAGNTLYLDEHDSLNLAWHHVYEPFETKFLLSQIKEGDVVLDLGAFIGYYTLLFADRVGSKGKVVAFEPSPMNYKILSKNVELYKSKKKI